MNSHEECMCYVSLVLPNLWNLSCKCLNLACECLNKSLFNAYVPIIGKTKSEVET